MICWPHRRNKLIFFLPAILALTLGSLSATTITDTSPAAGTTGTVITLQGAGFGASKPKVVATLAGEAKPRKAKLKILEASDTRLVLLVTKVSRGAVGDYTITVTPKGGGEPATSTFRVEGPTLAATAALEDAVAAQDVVAINGQNFGSKKPTVKLGKSKARVLSYTDSQIVVRLPKKLAPGSYSLTVDNKVGIASTSQAVEVNTLPSIALSTYAALAYANWSDSVDAAIALRDAIAAFLAGPSAEGLDAARAAWLAARPIYQQTELGRFYDGPIDREPDGPEGQINAWPLDENHIDYVEGRPDAGIVNDPTGYPALDAETLKSANASPGETDIALGWHAVEFLLWGQDRDPAGPGARPYTDYVTDGTGTAANQDRRGQYLLLAAEILVEDLTSVRDQWAPGTANFRAEFLAQDTRTALSRVLTGVGTLAVGELRGERILVPFTTKSQEDEHSCFSDTTHLDHLYDMIGIENAWLGRYDSPTDGRDINARGLSAVARAADPALADRITTLLSQIIAALSSPALVPFDQAIQGADASPGRAALSSAIQLLAQLNVEVSSLSKKLGVAIGTEL